MYDKLSKMQGNNINHIQYDCQLVIMLTSRGALSDDTVYQPMLKERTDMQSLV